MRYTAIALLLVLTSCYTTTNVLKMKKHEDEYMIVEEGFDPNSIELNHDHYKLCQKKRWCWCPAWKCCVVGHFKDYPNEDIFIHESDTVWRHEVMLR